VKSKYPTVYLKKLITVLTNYLVDKMPGRDLVGRRIRNTENVQGKVIGISLQRLVFNVVTSSKLTWFGIHLKMSYRVILGLL
jgi:hypothetical protein